MAGLKTFHSFSLINAFYWWEVLLNDTPDQITLFLDVCFSFVGTAWMALVLSILIPQNELGGHFEMVRDRPRPYLD